MSHTEKRGARYRARFTGPRGAKHSRTFSRKADAQRFLRELDAEMLRGSWVDPRDADMAVADWAEEFLSLCRRLAERTQETYRRHLTRFVLPGSGNYRLGHIPADEIENWLNDEIDAGIAPSSVHRHFRTLRRLSQVAVEKQKIATNPRHRVDPPRVPKREMVFLDWDEVLALSDELVERHRTMILFAVDTVALQRADGFWGVLAIGAFAVVIVASLARVAELCDRDDVERVVQLAIAAWRWVARADLGSLTWVVRIDSQ